MDSGEKLSGIARILETERITTELSQKDENPGDS